jgi:hypothetical protein
MLHLLILLLLAGVMTHAQESTLPPRDAALSGTWSAMIGDRPVTLELSATPTELLAAQISFPSERLRGLPLYRCERRGDSIFAESRTESIRIEAVYLRTDSTLDVLLIRNRIPSAAIFTRSRTVVPLPTPAPATPARAVTPPEPLTTVMQIPDRQKGTMRAVNITSPVTATHRGTAIIFAEGHLGAVRPFLDSLLATGMHVIWSDFLTIPYAKAALRTLPAGPVVVVGVGMGMDATARFDECDTTIKRVYLWYGHDPNEAGGRVQAQTYAARSCTGQRTASTINVEYSAWEQALVWLRGKR